jgi:hypothetical protein
MTVQSPDYEYSFYSSLVARHQSFIFLDLNIGNLARRLYYVL